MNNKEIKKVLKAFAKREKIIHDEAIAFLKGKTVRTLKKSGGGISPPIRIGAMFRIEGITFINGSCYLEEGGYNGMSFPITNDVLDESLWHFVNEKAC